MSTLSTAEGISVKVDSDVAAALSDRVLHVHGGGYIVFSARHSDLAHLSRHASKCKCNVYLHRYVMGLGVHKDHRVSVDHINADKTDARRANLRVVPQALNNFNVRSIRGHNRSGYTGVQLAARSGKFNASLCIRVLGSKIAFYLGVYSTAEEAAYAYDLAVVRICGPFITPYVNGAPPVAEVAETVGAYLDSKQPVISAAHSEWAALLKEHADDTSKQVAEACEAAKHLRYKTPTNLKRLGKLPVRIRK